MTNRCSLSISGQGLASVLRGSNIQLPCSFNGNDRNSSCIFIEIVALYSQMKVILREF